jgi:hypothetical protein
MVVEEVEAEEKAEQEEAMETQAGAVDQEEEEEAVEMGADAEKLWLSRKHVGGCSRH